MDDMPENTPDTPLGHEMARVTRAVDATLMTLLPKAQGAEVKLLEAMRYAVLESKERIRSFLAVQSGRLFGVDERAILRIAAAIECLHTSSQIHKALPALAERSVNTAPEPTHKAFDEGTAILAGDALQTLCFSILSSDRTSPDPFVRCEMIARLSAAAGHSGMVGGQMIDFAFAGREADIGTITRLQRMKTVALISFSCETGAVMTRAGEDLTSAMTGYAHDLGLAYQIVKDLETLEAKPNPSKSMSLEGSSTTLISVMGAERARSQADLLARQAISHLDLFDDKADFLRRIAEFVVHRPS